MLLQSLMAGVVKVKYPKDLQQSNSRQKTPRWNTLKTFIDSSRNAIKSNLNLAFLRVILS